jgi:hypothetical protein
VQNIVDDVVWVDLLYIEDKDVKSVSFGVLALAFLRGVYGFVPSDGLKADTKRAD